MIFDDERKTRNKSHSIYSRFFPYQNTINTIQICKHKHKHSNIYLINYLIKTELFCCCSGQKVRDEIDEEEDEFN